jgi:hypothetical protein
VLMGLTFVPLVLPCLVVLIGSQRRFDTRRRTVLHGPDCHCADNLIGVCWRATVVKATGDYRRMVSIAPFA